MPPSVLQPRPVGNAEPREPTRDERKNGWTTQSLARYLAERQQQTIDYAAEQSKRGSRTARAETTTTFDPYKWGN